MKGTTLNVELLEEILWTQSSSGQTKRMRKLIKRLAGDFGAEVFVEHGNVYVTKGQAEVYPCVVAHTDTVHHLIPNNEYVVCWDEKERVYFGWDTRFKTYAGVGGDDKVGIYIALAALEQFDVMKAVFFRDEEVGCLGSKLAKMEFFDDAAFVLECDRRGSKDFINDIWDELYGDEFSAAIKPYLEQFGYRETDGMMTDVAQLKEDGLKVACANMSCGYYNAHTSREYIKRDEVANTEALVFALVENLGHRQWTHEAPPRQSRWSRYGYGSYDSYDYDGSDWRRYYKPLSTTTKPTPALTTSATSKQECPRCGGMDLCNYSGYLWCIDCNEHVEDLLKTDDEDQMCPHCGDVLWSTWCYTCRAYTRDEAGQPVALIECPNCNASLRSSSLYEDMLLCTRGCGYFDKETLTAQSEHVYEKIAS